VSEVLIPSGGGYVKVDVEPYEKKWVEFSKREKLAKVKYRLPENSIIVYRILREKPDMSREVGVKAFLVTREGLRELEASSERVDVGSRWGARRGLQVRYCGEGWRWRCEGRRRDAVRGGRGGCDGEGS